MKRFIRTTHIAFLSASLFGLAGCSNSSEETAVTPAAAPAATKSDLASGLADAQNKAESEAAKLKAEVSAALAKQRDEVLSELSASTSSLTSQVTGLKKQYDSLKNALPEEVLKVVKEQIPDLETSVKKLKDMVAKYNPQSLEEIASFKAKYQKEYDIATKLIGEASKLLKNSGVKLPKLF
jgi:cell division septum initiation protein DivIVA